MLSVRDLHVAYGPVTALAGVSLDVREGEIVALLGANGAGRSTLIRAVCGEIHPSRGRIRLGERRIDRLPANAIARLGVAQVPEGRGVFPGLTVEENLRLGATPRRRSAGPVQDDLDWIFELFPILRTRARQIAGTMSGGEQQMLALARAMMARPRLLLLDEPSLGLAPRAVSSIYETVQRIHAEQGVTMLVVEQYVHIALQVASRAYVLQRGRVAASGTAREFRDDPARLRETYLGGEGGARAVAPSARSAR